MKFPAIIFDFDGTLVDTFPGILKCWQQTFSALSLGEPDPERIRAAIGPTKEIYLDMILGDKAEKHGEEAVKVYKRFYRETAPALTRVYKGVNELLSRLEAAGVRKAIASNKPLHQIMILAEKFGFVPRFDLILGPEKVDYGKPEPDMFLKCAEHLRLPREAFLVVGDTDLDMIAGQRAGMKRAAALWGYSTREKLAEFGPEYFAEKPADILEIIERGTHDHSRRH